MADQAGEGRREGPGRGRVASAASAEASDSAAAVAWGRLVVFSGGTGFNSVVRHLARLTALVSYCLPVSDTGGSTREIMNALGGPAIGDIRSRLLRLAAKSSAEERAVLALLEHRLPQDEAAAKAEWYSLLEGRGARWGGMSEACKQMIRAFLLHFNSELLKTASLRHHQNLILGQTTQPRPFSFRNGSIGNFFFSGARMFFGSLESAVKLWKDLANIHKATEVIPVVNFNHTVTIGADLSGGSSASGMGRPQPGEASGASTTDGGGGSEAGSVSAGGRSSAEGLGSSDHASRRAGGLRRRTILGQNEISHPAAKAGAGVDKAAAGGGGVAGGFAGGARISRIFYVNEFGQEITPPVSAAVLGELAEAAVVVFAMGSLFTSVVPCLVLGGVGQAIAHRTACRKVLILNAWPDRETAGMTAQDFVDAIVAACKQGESASFQGEMLPTSRFVNTLIYPEGGQIPVDPERLRRRGIDTIMVASMPATGAYVPGDLAAALFELAAEDALT